MIQRREKKILKQKNPFYLQGLERVCKTDGLQVTQEIKALEKQRIFQVRFLLTNLKLDSL